MTATALDVTIRPARLDDVDAVVAMGMRFATETDYGRVIVCEPARLRSLAIGLIETSDATLLVSEDDGVVSGMIGLVVCQHPMSLLRVCSELVWWVNPEARGHGRVLMAAAQAWAKAQAADLLFMIAPDEAVGRLYQRAGYAPLERVFYRRL